MNTNYRFKFDVRFVFIVVTFFALLAANAGNRARLMASQADAIKVLQKSQTIFGPSIIFDYETKWYADKGCYDWTHSTTIPNSGPTGLLIKLFGVESVCDVSVIKFSTAPPPDAMELVKRIRGVKQIQLVDCNEEEVAKWKHAFPRVLFQ